MGIGVVVCRIAGVGDGRSVEGCVGCVYFVCNVLVFVLTVGL